MMPRFAIVFAFVGAISFWCWCPQIAMAHAVHVRSNPRQGDVLAETPLLIEIWFDQPLFSGSEANTIHVMRDGDHVYSLPGTVDQADPTRLYAGLPGILRPGKYDVVWSSLSAVDGDVTSGRFSFVVGVENANVEMPPAQATPYGGVLATSGTIVPLAPPKGGPKPDEYPGENFADRTAWLTKAMIVLIGTSALIWTFRRRT